MPDYPSELTLRDGRATYFRSNGVPPGGGYDDKWVVIRARSIPIAVFPNTAQRVRALRLHDLHHVLTGYDTDLAGEAEIGAWEIASGCRDFWAAWLLNGLAALAGLLICPRRVARAYRRGRGQSNLYAEGYADGLLDQTVGEVRSRLGVSPESDRV